MKLSTRITIPSLVFLSLLIGLGATYYFHEDAMRHEENEVAALEDQILDMSHLISGKFQDHIVKSITLLTQLESEAYDGDLKADISMIKQLEVNTITYIKSFQKSISEFPDRFQVSEQLAEIQKLRTIYHQYFNHIKQALRIVHNNENLAAGHLMEAVKYSVEAQTKLNLITDEIEVALREGLFDKQKGFSGTISVIWWLFFAFALCITLWFIIWTITGANKLRTVVSRFSNLFPETNIAEQIESSTDGIKQLEWLAQQLEQTKGDLLASQNRLNKIISQSNLAIYVHRDMKPLFANKATMEMFGFKSFEDLKDTLDLRKLMPQREYERLIGIYNTRIQGGKVPPLYEMEIIRKDGSSGWVLNKSFTLEWEDEPAICTTLIDITERKLAERQLLDSEDRFQVLLELTPDPIFIHGLDGKILDANVAATESLGYTPDEFQAMNISDFTPSTPTETPHFFLKSDRASSFIKSVHTYHRRKDGSQFPVETNITSGMLAGQKVLLTIAHDMTETMAHIEELNDMRQKAEEANKTKSEFLSMMSHELRTPLNAIIGYSDLILQKERQKGELSKQAKWIEQIHISGQELLDIVDKVLDLISIDKDLGPNNTAQIDLVHQLDGLLEVYGDKLEKRHITVHKQFMLNECLIATSDQALYIILDNLLSNAIKFNHDGGEIFIRITDTSPTHVVLRVRDTGIGIDPELVKDAFQPFNRLGHENGPIPGNGIGLTLVEKVCQQIDGSVEIVDPKLEGFTIEVTLPKAYVI